MVICCVKQNTIIAIWLAYSTMFSSDTETTHSMCQRLVCCYIGFILSTQNIAIKIKRVHLSIRLVRGYIMIEMDVYHLICSLWIMTINSFDWKQASVAL